MIRYALLAVATVFITACNSSPSQTAENTVGGANVVSSAQAPMARATTSLSIDWGSKGQAGQVAVADVLSYGGSKPTINPPAGWQLIRDDSTKTTRQSLYWHAIRANDTSTATWTFSEPVNAQGAVVLLDNVASVAPVDASSGNTSSPGLTAKSVTTTTDGDLILAFYATDFGGGGLNPQMPTNMSSILDMESAPREYWILGTYQSHNGETQDAACASGQSFSWVAAQVAIKHGAASSAAH